MTLSVTIAAKNEEKNIGRCLDAVRWADEAVVVDDLSTDRTADICRRHGAVLIQHDSAGYFHANKNLAIERARGEWILSLDADEVVSPELAGEIRETVKTGRAAAYYISRRNYFLGRWVRGCGWYPDRSIRLFRKGATSWPVRIIVNDTPPPPEAGEVGSLAGPLLHYSYESIDQYLEKFGRYTTVLCRQYHASGRHLKPHTLAYIFAIRPVLIFLRKYFWLMGFRDGFRGLFISLSAAAADFVAHAKLWEMQQDCSKLESGQFAAPQS